MRVAVVTEPFKVEVLDKPVPEIGPKDVLIKAVRVGICGSDLHLFKGTHAFRNPPADLGHEISGEVAEVGAEVTKLKVGDRVTVEPQIGCGECEYCKSGHINLCKSKIVPGTPKWGGTFAEYFAAPEQTVYKLADDVSFDKGALTEPLAVAVQAINNAESAGKDAVAILGSGTIGLLCLAVCVQKGYKKIFCTDTAPFNREMALKLGATAAYDPITEDVETKIKEATDGEGVDVCVVAAGAPGIVDQASSITKKLGSVILVAMITKPIEVYTYSFVFNEQKLIGSMTYTTEAFKEAVDMINGGIAVEDIITHCLPLEEAGKGLDILDKKTENAGKILVHLD